jgi:uncharacterized membrane protein
MPTIEESIEVNVPVTTAYNQWTQFEEFPSFMKGVDEVRQLDDTRLHWVVSHGGQTHEWDAEITEQRPDERVAWKSIGGKGNAGAVTFHRIDEKTTRLMVQIDWETEGMMDQLGSALGSDDRRVKSDLERFKEMIEARGEESGAWRGEVEQGDVSGSRGA